jgi:hypothetical protein
MFGRYYFTIELENLGDVEKIRWIYGMYREIEIEIEIEIEK